MIITIEGEKGEGKSILAVKICEDRKYTVIQESDLGHPFWTARLSIDESVEVIIIDSVKDFDRTYLKFLDESLIIDSPCEKSSTIPMPDVILITRRYQFSAIRSLKLKINKALSAMQKVADQL